MKRLRFFFCACGIAAMALLVLRLCGINWYKDGTSMTTSVLWAIGGFLICAVILLTGKFGDKIKKALHIGAKKPDDTPLGEVEEKDDIDLSKAADRQKLFSAGL